ncbi:MAG: dockerin type I repeat-containing protein [Alloprevotella sp.]|nr:dockerin type I repeat-containing protein [Alloprevotella sp.]
MKKFITIMALACLGVFPSRAQYIYFVNLGFSTSEDRGPEFFDENLRTPYKGKISFRAPNRLIFENVYISLYCVYLNAENVEGFTIELHGKNIIEAPSTNPINSNTSLRFEAADDDASLTIRGGWSNRQGLCNVTGSGDMEFIGGTYHFSGSDCALASLVSDYVVHGALRFENCTATLKANGDVVSGFRSVEFAGCCISNPEDVSYASESAYTTASGEKVKEMGIEPGFDLYVGGRQVTRTNAGDVLGTGKVRYDDATKTLTLDGGDYIMGKGDSSAREKQYGICSHIDGLTIIVTDTTYVSQSLNPSASKVAGLGLFGNTTITGSAALLCGGYDSGITVGYSSALTVDGNVTLTGMDGQYGISGSTRTESGVVLFNAGLTVRGGATVRAKGTKQSLYGFQDFVLEDNHTVTSPDGAVWNTWHHAVSYGTGITSNDVKNEFVVIAAPANPCDLNKDGAVDVSDVTELVSYVLNPDGSHATDYDLNKDGAVDVSDVTELVSTVLAQ